MHISVDPFVNSLSSHIKVKSYPSGLEMAPKIIFFDTKAVSRSILNIKLRERFRRKALAERT